MGVIVSYIFSLMYMDNPLCSPMPVYDRLGDEFLASVKITLKPDGTVIVR